MAIAFTHEDLIAFLRRQKYAVVSSTDSHGQPQGAGVGIATSDRGEVMVDTLGTTRKAANLRRGPGVVLTV